MTHTRAKEDSQRQRKVTLRKMDRVVGTVSAHARRYRELLDEQWEQTEWSRPQTEQVLRRMDQVLEQLPKARKQARQRIISGQLVDNQEKILSLYEREVRVIVRKKAGAEVEFGNTLLIGENPQGLILDWELFKESAPADSRLLPRSAQRMKKVFGPVLKAIGTDRGFDSAANQEALADDGIYNGVCPRSPHQLKERLGSWKFRKMQRRRSQTEGRVAILKNMFIGQPMRSKGFQSRELTVAWAVLTHNLWVMARMSLAAQAQQKLAA
jgi:IS5 family transposase